MRIQRIRLARFATHDLTEVVLPEVGVVVVTGPNGAGKSALVEAVASAIWGKTLRGVPGWRAPGAETLGAARAAARRLGGSGPGPVLRADDIGPSENASGAEVVTGVFRAARWKCGAASPKLGWELREDTEEGRAALSAARLGAYRDTSSLTAERAWINASEWESSAHAQAALDRVAPGFEVWRRSCVFSSSDAAHFSLATDGERKRLLEAVLGLHRFDPALEACRADLSAARGELARAEAELAVRRALLQAGERELAEARRALDALGEPPPDPGPPRDRRADLTAARERAEKARRRGEAVRERLRQLDAYGAVAAAECARLTRELARAEAGACPACGQAVPPSAVDAVRAKLENATRARPSALERAAVAEELEDALDADRAASRRVMVLETEIAQAAEMARLRRGAARERELAHARVRAKLADCAAGSVEIANQLEPRLEALRTRAATLAEVEGALGLRGVRAQVLARALAGVSAAACSWLARLGKPALRVELRPGTETKGGGTVDAISVRVSGAGGGYGYKGASAGERRRIDVALLLALGTVAEAASGTFGSTLFLDELFDGLDAEGREDAAHLVGELGRDRCVVLITHDADLARRVPATRRLRVEAGVVAEGV